MVGTAYSASRAMPAVGKKVRPGSPSSTRVPAARAAASQSVNWSASGPRYQTSPARITSAASGPRSSRLASVNCTAIPLSSAFKPTAASQNGSMSAASTAAAPARAAAIATTPEPLAKSTTRLPATSCGWSSR